MQLNLFEAPPPVPLIRCVAYHDVERVRCEEEAGGHLLHCAYKMGAFFTWRDPMLIAALAYAQRWHFAVFPLDRSSKCPYPGTHGFKDATTDLDKIKWLWRDRIDANVGIATGEVSGLTALDIDPRNGGDWEALSSFCIAPTVDTPGGGQHLYYGYHTDMPKCLSQGIDIKSDGGYVVAPPSKHPNGGIYVWRRKLHIKALSPPARFPDPIYDKLEGKYQRRRVNVYTKNGLALSATDQEWILSRLDVQRIRGDEHICRCPVHTEANGSFRLNFVMGCFHCFGCGFKGRAEMLLDVLQ